MSAFLLWLRDDLGAWPPTPPASLVASPCRATPGWDGQVRRIVGVASPEDGTQVSVSPDALADARELGAPRLTDGAWLASLAATAGLPNHAWKWSDRTVLRWLDPGDPVADLADAGEWVDPADERVPGWLRPFNGGVLAFWGEDGGYLAGVGVKRHADGCAEIAVGTEPEARGRGLARRLVATATRSLLAGNSAVLYLHHKDNAASSAVAEAVGFADRGWRMCGPVPAATDDDPW